MTNNTNEHRDAISGWEDEGGGGAGLSDQQGQGIAEVEKRAHETGAEQTARRNREDLKRRLAARLKPGAGRKLRRK
jgi:hypothetical protein